MFKDSAVINGFSVSDTEKAKNFYGTVLGLAYDEGMGGILTLHFVNGGSTFVYPKENHEPATFTIMNIIVEDIEKAVDGLTAKGVQFERYDGMQLDEKGIAWGKKVNMGPNIAWFKDPFGNILSLLED
jgi:catechol 2,3-dioxygenase-like lactoylglutathione lyase family enzyme